MHERIASAALKELAHAEDELRLLHTNVSHLRRANGYLLRAQMKLIDLSEWIIKESQK